MYEVKSLCTMHRVRRAHALRTRHRNSGLEDGTRVQTRTQTRTQARTPTHRDKETQTHLAFRTSTSPARRWREQKRRLTSWTLAPRPILKPASATPPAPGPTSPVALSNRAAASWLATASPIAPSWACARGRARGHAAESPRALTAGATQVRERHVWHLCLAACRIASIRRARGVGLTTARCVRHLRLLARGREVLHATGCCTRAPHPSKRPTWAALRSKSRAHGT